MEKTTLIAVAALLAGCATVQPDHFVAVNAVLRDGSSVTGEFTTRRFRGTSDYGKPLSFDADMVKSVCFTGLNGKSEVEFASGDKVSMTVYNDSFGIVSRLGYLNIPRDSFLSLAFSRHKLPPSDVENGLVFHCTFDDESEIATPRVGPGGVFRKGEFLKGKNGKALFLPARTSGAKFGIPDGTIGAAGTIEFWGKVDDEGPFSSYGCPRFFQICSPESNAEISQDWNANNGLGGSGLTFRIDGLPVLNASRPTESSSVRRRLPTTPPAGWHHYAIAWDAKGIGPSSEHSAVVYLDGQPVLSSPFNPKWPGPAKLAAGATLFIPTREDRMPDYARHAYAIDDFKIWNRAKTDFK